MKKQLYAVEVSTFATVKSKVLVEASSREDALKKVKNIDTDASGLTDSDGNPIEGLGDLIWKYDHMSEESVDAGKINVSISHVVK